MNMKSNNNPHKCSKKPLLDTPEPLNTKNSAMKPNLNSSWKMTNNCRCKMKSIPLPMNLSNKPSLKSSNKPNN